MTWISAFSKRHGVSISVFLGMAGLWQILSMVFTAEAVPGEPMVPGWQIVFSRTLLSLADYWQGGLGVPSVAEGAPRPLPSFDCRPAAVSRRCLIYALRQISRSFAPRPASGKMPDRLRLETLRTLRLRWSAISASVAIIHTSLK